MAIDALQTGEGVAASVGELTTSSRTITVLNAASIGIYPDFVAQRARRRARLGKWLGGVAATWRELRDAEAIDIELEGKETRVWSVFASVGRNTPGHVATMQRQTLSDDVLDVRVLHARGSRLQAVASLSFGKTTRTVLRTLRLLPPASDVEHLTAAEIQIHVLRGTDAPPSTRTTANSSAARRSTKTAATRCRAGSFPRRCGCTRPTPSRVRAGERSPSRADGA